MTTTKHTPGPWYLQGPKVQEDFGGQTYWTIATKNMSSITFQDFIIPGFYYPHSKQSQEQSEANAKLIAAAPDLLEALTNHEMEMCLLEFSTYDKKSNGYRAYEKIMSAIKKATT